MKTIVYKNPFLYLLIFLYFLPIPVFAQFTRVSGTVQDSNGIPYAGGTISAVLVPGSAGGWRLSGQPYSGRLQNTALDSTGSFTVQMGDNNVITPSGTQWVFTVNSNPGGILPPLGTGSQTFTSTITITGASQSISTTLQAATPKLTNITLGAGTLTGTCTNTGLAYGLVSPTALACDTNLTWNSTNQVLVVIGDNGVRNDVVDVQSALNTNNNVWRLDFTGPDANGAIGAYTELQSKIISNTPAALSSQFDIFTLNANALVDALSISKEGNVTIPGSFSLGAGSSACGAGTTSCFAGVEAATACTPTVGQICKRLDSVTNNTVTSANGAAEVPELLLTAPPAGSKCLQTSGTSGGVTEATNACGTGVISGLTTGFLPKAASATSIANSLCDEGITTANALTCPDTAGIRSPAFTSTGTTAGFIDFPQGTDSGAVAPCNAATSICWEAPISVTSYKGILPGAAATGIPHYANAANVITETISAINLAGADVTGVTPVANGGTGLATQTSNVVYKGNGTGVEQVSSMTDNGTNVTSTDTGGFIAPVFVSNGSTAGFVDYPQGSTSAAVAPCNAATSICRQAPAAVTSYVLNLAAAAPVNNNSAEVFSNANPGVGTFAKMPQTAITSGTAYTNATTTFSNVVGSAGQTLQLTVEANTNYILTCQILWSASGATSGPKFQFTGPAAPTAVQYSVVQAVTATTDGTAGATAFSTSLNASGATVVTGTNEPAELSLGLVNGANAGTVVLQAAAQGAGTLTIQPGSFCQGQ